jgi:predicted transposase YbfD/YdcC
MDCFAKLPDPRVNRTRDHLLIDILVICLCSILAGGEGFNDMEEFGKAKKAWFSTFLELPNGIPRHDTFNRVFQALDPNAFLDCFLRWTEALRTILAGEVVAVDGKALRRALAKSKGTSLPYIVSAWAASNGLVLGQVKVNDKSNEITAVPELLRALDLKGCIVTTDAMGCQKKIARQITEQGADFALALKGNQETVHDEVRSFMDDLIERWQRNPRAVPGLGFHETVEKDHGRGETRRYWQCCDVDWFADRDQWKGLRSFGAVESVREIDGVMSVERRYHLLSLGPDVLTYAKANRQHWGVENNVHWTLDVAFKEDQSRARMGHAAHNLATLRRLALNALRRAPVKISLRLKIKKAGWDNDFLLNVLGIDPS